MRKRKKLTIGAAVLAVGVYINNASWTTGPPDGEMTLLAHRGVHQTYHRNDLNNETCTAERIDLPTHNYLENTIESMQAAKKFGAQIIELDIHMTTDGEFAVFHDWKVDCRTNGSGETRKHSMTELRALDIGYGYTADGGKSFPFRGKFVGQIPTLRDVLEQVQDVRFLINLKSRSKKQANALIEYLNEEDWKRLIFVGHPDPLTILQSQKPDIIYVSRQATKACLKSYLLTGWTGHVPKTCHNMYVSVPANLRYLAWGWPHKFESRLNAVGSRSMLVGDLGSHLAGGIDQQRDIERIPDGYTGIVYSNKIEFVGPKLRTDAQSSE